MKKPIDQKKHFKMYKSGKIWVVAGITAISLLSGGMQAAHADEVSTITNTTDISTSASETNMATRSSAIANNTYVDTQDNIDISKDDQATNAKSDIVNNANKQNEATTNLNQTVGQSKVSLNSDTQSTEKSINNDSRENDTDNLKENTKAITTVDRTVNRDDDFAKLSNGKTVYYDSEGKIQYGLQIINGKFYYFNTENGEMCTNKELEINNNWYNFTSDGSASTGFTKLASGKTVYYNAQGQMQYGLQTINGEIYYFNPWSGEMYAGREAQINGKWYNFTSDGSASTGFTKLASGKTVYYNAQGQMQYGLQTINGKIYYFNPWSGEMYAGKEAQINDKWYNFTSDGSASTGFTKLASGKTVYYNDQGQMQHGEKKIDNKWFYFSENTGNVAGGFTTLPDGRRVYYDIDFHDISKSKGMLYGEQTLKNLKYYFNVQSGAQEKGVVYNIATGRLQYYGAIDGSLSIELQSPVNTDEDGNIILNDGENEINGKWYYYAVQNGKIVTGWKKLIDNNHGGYREVYYDLDTAQMVHGEKEINGVWYYFDKQNGSKAVSSFVKLADGRIAYYDEKGHMSYGEKKIGNYWYYFNSSNGNEAVSSFIKLNDGRTVYYNAQGHMVYNWQNINGSTYYFNPQNGNMYVGAQWINGQEYYFDYITGAQVKDQWTAKLLEWFFNRMGKLTYSMDGSRNGADGTADCSGSLTQALYEAGAWRYSLLYNTEMLHSYLLGNGYHLAYENNDYTSPEVGDVIIWGQRGRSAGGAGHTGVISGSGRNGTMVSTCYWTEGEKGTAVQNFPYFWYWGKDNYPYYYVYRR